MGALWQGKESSWRQDDVQSVFKLESIRGVACLDSPENRVSLSLLLGAKLHPEAGGEVTCGSAGKYFPSDFNHCPYCNSLLITPKADSAISWIPPYGQGNGLKILSTHLPSGGFQLGSGSVFPVPPRGGRFTFFVTRMGGDQRQLFALDRIIGALWSYHPDRQEWVVFSGYLGEDCLPEWSWSSATDALESGVCVPTQRGPAWVEVNWATGGVLVEYANGVSIGGPIASGKHLLAPVVRNNVFGIVYRSNGAWADCTARSDSALVLSELHRTPSQLAACGVPVVDEVRNIVYWPLRGGYVKVSGFAAGTPVWEFRHWETDEDPATALIELGPPLWRTGTRPGFWQLCEDRDRSVRDGIVNKLIKIDGDSLADVEVVECGQFLTTGQACFAWSEDYWVDVQQRNTRLEEQSDLRFPLLQFGDKGLVLLAKVMPWEGRDESAVFTDFVYDRSTKNRVNVRFVLENEGAPELPLCADGVDAGARNNGSLFRATLANVVEISSFVLGNGLYIYLPEENRCYRWTVAWGQ